MSTGQSRREFLLNSVSGLSAAWVAASTTRSDSRIRLSSGIARWPAAVAGSRTVTPASATPGMPFEMALAMWVPITPMPTMPTLIMAGAPLATEDSNASGDRQAAC